MWIGFSFSQDFLGGHFNKFKDFSATILKPVLRAGKSAADTPKACPSRHPPLQP